MCTGYEPRIFTFLPSYETPTPIHDHTRTLTHTPIHTPLIPKIQNGLPKVTKTSTNPPPPFSLWFSVLVLVLDE